MDKTPGLSQKPSGVKGNLRLSCADSDVSLTQITTWPVKGQFLLLLNPGSLSAAQTRGWNVFGEQSKQWSFERRLDRCKLTNCLGMSKRLLYTVVNKLVPESDISLTSQYSETICRTKRLIVFAVKEEEPDFFLRSIYARLCVCACVRACLCACVRAFLSVCV